MNNINDFIFSTMDIPIFFKMILTILGFTIVGISTMTVYALENGKNINLDPSFLKFFIFLGCLSLPLCFMKGYFPLGIICFLFILCVHIIQSIFAISTRGVKTDTKKELTPKLNSENNENIVLNNSDANKQEKQLKLIEQYERNPNLKQVCIKNAEYLCEIDKSHLSFEAKTTNKNYVESHHIIPLKFQADFNENLDCLENLISLCPDCHKGVHYGTKQVQLKLLQEILNVKRPFNITLEQLQKYYDI